MKEGEKTRELSENRRHCWLAINCGDLKPDNYPILRVCSDHFIKEKPAALYEESNPDWVPSLKIGHGEKRSLATSSRHDRAVKRSAKQKRNGEEQDKGEIEREIIEIDHDHEVQ